ncbi:unnamed protein product [Arctogadus glacialis]
MSAVRTFTEGLCHHNKQDCVSGSSLRRARVTVPESLRACTEQSVSKDNGKQGVFCSEIVPCGTPSAARWAGRGVSGPYDRRDHACLWPRHFPGSAGSAPSPSIGDKHYAT